MSLLTLVRFYFGMPSGSTGDLVLPTISSSASAIDKQIQALAPLGDMGVVSADRCTKFAEESGEVEGAIVVAQQQSKEMLRLAQNRLRLAQVMASHHQGMARVASQTAQLQRRHLQTMAPIALQTAVTTSKHAGYRNGLENSAAALTGGQ